MSVTLWGRLYSSTIYLSPMITSPSFHPSIDPCYLLTYVPQGLDSYLYSEDAWIAGTISFNPYQSDLQKLEIEVS